MISVAVDVFRPRFRFLKCSFLTMTSILLGASSIFAAAAEISPHQKPYFFEFLTFRATDHKNSKVEVYCRFPVENLKFVRTRQGVSADYRIKVILHRTDGLRRQELEYPGKILFQSNAAMLASKETQMLKFEFNVEPGQYDVRASVFDTEAPSRISFRKSLTVPDYACEDLRISDIQMASALSQVTSTSGLVKNGRKIVPTVSRQFGLHNEKIYLYYELYNLKSPPGDNHEIQTTITLTNEARQKQKKTTYRHEIPGNSGAVSLAIPTDQLASGRYDLTLDILDPKSGQKVQKLTNFYIDRALPAYVHVDSDKVLRQIELITSQAEVAGFHALPPSERFSAIEAFWNKLDPTPGTERNKFREEFYRRVHFSNRNFGNHLGEGWESDQGIVYLKNGPPDLIDALQPESDEKNYEIWKYGDLNRQFIFVDNFGFGEFQLLKSANRNLGSADLSTN